jgi:serine/threonine-protein kinase
MMQATQFARIEELFHAALDRPEAEREAFLHAQEADAEVRDAVLRLLARHAAEDATLVGAVAAAAAVTPAAPRQIGPYRVLGELGVGGMGMVLLAERQLGDARQKVALKLIRGFPTASARERLARERSLLAGLNHPNIAGLLDAGETDDHVPYLAMEYVEGIGLHRYCSEHELDLRARLRLFVQLCRAVQHAHQRLVVHRDIKPGNILVREDGTPVLLDFGIGKLLDATDREATATHVFTPAYAAPEQVAGRAVTTAADIWGLGCVLHELLSGRMLSEINQDSRVPPPSVATLDPARVRTLRGELDTLVGKAMHPEPERRYASAQALADDVENYLHGRPIAAAPDSLAYRTRKFAARHRLAVFASAVVVLLAVVFVWSLNNERRRAVAAETRAEREANSARRQRDFLVSLFNAASPENSLGHPLTARELIDKGEEALAKTLKDEPDASARISQTIASAYSALGDPKAAIAAGERALALANGSSADDALLRADVLANLVTDYDNTERFDDARRAGEQALVLRQQFAPEDRASIATLYAQLGDAANRRGEPDQARSAFEHALAELDRLAAPAPKDRAQVWSGIAESDVQQGRFADGVKHAQQAVRLLDELPPQSPLRLSAWRMLARAQIAASDGAAGTKTLEHALKVVYETLGEDSYRTADVENDLAVALDAIGRYREAIAHLEKSLAIVQKLRPGERGANAYTVLNLGSLYENLGDYARAEELMRDGVTTMETETPDEAQLDFFRGNLARTLMLRGKYAEARALVLKAMQGIAARDGEDSFNYAYQNFRRARIELADGKVDAAAKAGADATRVLDPLLPPQHGLRVQIHVLDALIAKARGDLDTAQREFALAEEAQKELGGDPVLLASVQERAAGVALARGDLAAARARLEPALRVIDAALLPQALEYIEAHRLWDELLRREAAP